MWWWCCCYKKGGERPSVCLPACGRQVKDKKAKGWAGSVFIAGNFKQHNSQEVNKTTDLKSAMSSFILIDWFIKEMKLFMLHLPLFLSYPMPLYLLISHSFHDVWAGGRDCPNRLCFEAQRIQGENTWMAQLQETLQSWLLCIQMSKSINLEMQQYRKTVSIRFATHRMAS